MEKIQSILGIFHDIEELPNERNEHKNDA